MSKVKNNKTKLEMHIRSLLHKKRIQMSC